MRDRPARFGLRPPFKRSGGVLVGPHNGGIDRHRPADVVDGIRCGEDSGENFLPRAVPTAHLISRLRAVWNEPSFSKRRSRQGELVRYFHAMASSVRRWSAHRRPRTGSAGISGAIRSHITSVILHRTDTSDQLTNPSQRHALAHTLLDAIPPTRSSERRRPGGWRSGAMPCSGQRGSGGRAPRRNCVTAVPTSPSSRAGSIMPLLSMEVIPRTVA